jgi:hypothetical protein
LGLPLIPPPLAVRTVPDARAGERLHVIIACWLAPSLWKEALSVYNALALPPARIYSFSLMEQIPFSPLGKIQRSQLTITPAFPVSSLECVSSPLPREEFLPENH